MFFVRENTLVAAPFDAAGGQVSGEVFPVTEAVSITTDSSYFPATVSENGVLLYQAGGTTGGTNQMAWHDRTGKFFGLVGEAGGNFDPAISPDEQSGCSGAPEPVGVSGGYEI